MEGKVAIAHFSFLIINLFIVIDFWQLNQKTDKVSNVQEKAVYSISSSSGQNQAYGTYEIYTDQHLFEIPKKYATSFYEGLEITLYCTQFLHVIRYVEVDNQLITVTFWLYVAIALAVIVIAAIALFLYKSPDFQSFAAIINGLLSLMVIYLVWF